MFSLFSSPFHDGIFICSRELRTHERPSDRRSQSKSEFDYATTQDISPHNYTLLSAAKDIYSDGSSVALNDLAISEVVDTLAFSLIVNALLIARYGCSVLKISEKEGKE